MKYRGEDVTIETVKRQEDRFEEIKPTFSSKILGVFHDAIEDTPHSSYHEKLKQANDITEDLIAMEYFLDKVLKDPDLDKTVKSAASSLQVRVYPLMRQAEVMRSIYIERVFDNDYITYRKTINEPLEDQVKEHNDPVLNNIMGESDISDDEER